MHQLQGTKSTKFCVHPLPGSRVVRRKRTGCFTHVRIGQNEEKLTKNVKTRRSLGTNKVVPFFSCLFSWLRIRTKHYSISFFTLQMLPTPFWNNGLFFVYLRLLPDIFRCPYGWCTCKACRNRCIRKPWHTYKNKGMLR